MCQNDHLWQDIVDDILRLAKRLSLPDIRWQWVWVYTAIELATMLDEPKLFEIRNDNKYPSDTAFLYLFLHSQVLIGR